MERRSPQTTKCIRAGKNVRTFVAPDGQSALISITVGKGAPTAGRRLRFRSLLNALCATAVSSLDCHVSQRFSVLPRQGIGSWVTALVLTSSRGCLRWCRQSSLSKCQKSGVTPARSRTLDLGNQRPDFRRPVPDFGRWPLDFEHELASRVLGWIHRLPRPVRIPDPNPTYSDASGYAPPGQTSQRG